MIDKDKLYGDTSAKALERVRKTLRYFCHRFGWVLNEEERSFTIEKTGGFIRLDKAESNVKVIGILDGPQWRLISQALEDLEIYNYLKERNQ